MKVTRETVLNHFHQVELKYPVKLTNGDSATVPMPGWRCKECGWESFPGFKGMPLPHSCAEVRKARGKIAPAIRFS